MHTGVAVLEYLNHDTEETCMLITCPKPECNSKATISSRHVKDEKVSDLYCSCKDPLCGHTFVMTLSFSHSLSPSAKDGKDMIKQYLSALPRQDQLELIESMRV